jgi:hypothetical protein
MPLEINFTTTRVGVRDPLESRTFCSTRRPYPRSFTMGTDVSFPGIKQLGVMPTAHLQVLMKSR